MDETWVYFWVQGFGKNVDIITRRTGLAPTKVQNLCWQFQSPLPLSTHIDDQLEALLEILEPKSEVIRQISVEFEAGINAAVYYRKDFSPGIHLSEKTIERLAKMNLSADFDLYFLGADPDD